MNIWNTICKDILEKKIKQVTEKEYQELAYTYFRYLLGWSCERVEKQYQLRVGSTVNNVYPDMVFFQNDNPVFVVEMKKPNHTQTKEEVVQLLSYMKLLPVQIGLYIGEHIELFYYDFSKEPISVLKIDFTTDSSDGKCFVELFKQEKFSLVKLTSFCKEQIEIKEREDQISEFINELLTEKGKQFITELLTSRLLNDGYSAENIANIINEIEISVCRKNHIPTLSRIQKTPLIKQHIVIKKQLDHTRYKLNGYGNYGKGRLALAIVQLFVENNPNLTYYEIVNAIPFGIEKYSEIQKWKANTNDLHKETRWFENDLMTSADGINFAFTTQIGRHNIGGIIDFAITQGYIVEAIK